jgi:hypothetical protein
MELGESGLLLDGSLEIATKELNRLGRGFRMSFIVAG